MTRRAPPNPRMQPTGRSGASFRGDGALPERAVERTLVWARAWGPAADAQCVRRTAARSLLSTTSQVNLVFYETPDDVHERISTTRRLAWRGLWPGLALILVGFGLAFVAAGLGNRALQVAAFAL